MPRHADYCTLLVHDADRDILTRPLFDVNLRLYRTSNQYRIIVDQCIEYLRWCATTTKDGYKKPHGYSGANAGIPWNIVALADGTVMVNPCILEATGRRSSTSNCGSLLLDRPIKIWRYRNVRVWYLDAATWEEHVVEGYLPTVQHEIDHNKGVLITDRAV